MARMTRMEPTVFHPRRVDPMRAVAWGSIALFVAYMAWSVAVTRAPVEVEEPALLFLDEVEYAAFVNASADRSGRVAASALRRGVAVAVPAGSRVSVVRHVEGAVQVEWEGREGWMDPDDVPRH
jgi:hypothetical protein